MGDLPRGFLPSILMGLMLLKDKVALITGSGRGIGRAIAHLFAKEGAAVFLTARTKEQLDSTTAEIFKGGGRAGYLAADLSRQAGVILNISSLSAKAAFSWSSAYAAAKAGMLGLTRVTAAEGARKGVRVNAICPGPVTETQMSKDLGAVLAKKMGVNEDEQLAGFLNGLLQGRAQTAEEIARAALFLCSEQSSAMTGQSVNVDGGGAFY